MPGPGRRRLLGTACGVLLAASAVVGAAGADPGAGRGHGPSAHAACAAAPGVLCQESGKVDLPPDSYGSQATDTVPAAASEASTFLEPLNAQEQADFDATWPAVVDNFPRFANVKSVFVRRVVTCAVLARGAADVLHGAYADDPPAEGDIASDNAYSAYLAVCIQTAVIGQRTAKVSTAGTSRTRCYTAQVSAPIQIRRVGRRYFAHLTGNLTLARGGRPALTVSCQPKRRGLVIRVRASGRHRLRRVIGSHLSVGFSNPTPHAVPFRTTYAFR